MFIVSLCPSLTCVVKTMSPEQRRDLDAVVTLCTTLTAAAAAVESEELQMTEEQQPG